VTAVVDASVAVASLTEKGDDGVWATSVLRRSDLVAPHLLPAEVAAALRGLVRGGRLDSGDGGEALRSATEWQIELYPLATLASRVWELRDNLTPYDAWYVALAEHHDAPLATLDRRLAASSGPRCEFLLPR
jgi:predicted nucleic acid-binding protein